MNKRPGMISVMILVFLTGLLAVMAGAGTAALRSAEAGASYEKGIQAVYAAESGATWALAYLSEKGLPEQTVWMIHTGEGTRGKVTIKGTVKSETAAEGKIYSAGTEEETGMQRFVGLSFQMEKSGDRWQVTVTQAEAGRNDGIFLQ